MDISLTAPQIVAIAKLVTNYTSVGISTESDGSVYIQVADDDGNGGEYAIGHWIVSIDGTARPAGTCTAVRLEGEE